MANVVDSIQKPLLIGVSGGSASGKTTFARMVKAAFGEEHCDVLLQDSYYYDHSQSVKVDQGAVNFDHPSAIDFELLHEQLSLLQQGHSIQMPSYCFKTHARLAQTQLVRPKKITLVDGILIYSDARLRRLFDARVFISTNEELRFDRRLKRDVAERGRQPEGVHQQFYSQVKPMHDQFVEPSKAFADVTYSGEQQFDEPLHDFVGYFKELVLSRQLLS